MTSAVGGVAEKEGSTKFLDKVIDDLAGMSSSLRDALKDK